MAPGHQRGGRLHHHVQPAPPRHPQGHRHAVPGHIISTIISDNYPIQWESGYATKLLLNIGGDMKLMSAVNGDYNIAGGLRFYELSSHGNLPRMGP